MAHVQIAKIMDINTTLDLPCGTKMPIFGLGTARVKAEELIRRSVECAIDEGYTLIDTARLYRNEAFIGNVLKERLSSGTLKREDIFITSKLGQIYMATPQLIERSLSLTLRELQVDYVDLYLIHYPCPYKYVSDTDLVPLQDGKLLTDEADLVEVWQTLERFVDEGKVKAIGVSNFNISQIQRILAVARHPISNLQVEINPYIQQDTLVEFCRKHGIPVTAFAPLGAPGTELIKEGDGKPILLQDPVLRAIALKHKKTTAQVALRYLMENGLAVVPKSVTPSRIKENSEIFDFALDPDDITQIKKLDRHLRLTLVPQTADHPEYPFKE